MKDDRVKARGFGGHRLLAFSWQFSPRHATVVVSLLAISLLALPAAALAAGDVIPDPTPYLVLTTRGDAVLVDVPLPPDHTWRLEWTHSVAQVQVVDVFAWRDGVMYVTDQFTPYLDIAGLGAFAGHGELIELSDGSYHLANIDFPLHGNAHNLIIGSVRAPSVLIVGESRFALSETHPATHARIEVKLK